MAEFLFAGLDHVTLSAELARPLQRVSITTLFGKFPCSITLWRADGTGLKVYSEMRDIAERLEVGVLHFAPVPASGSDEISFNVPPSFQDGVKPFVLLIHESGTTAESGIILRASSGDEIIIVAAGMPCNLTFRGIPELNHRFDPEYPFEEYEIAGLSSGLDGAAGE